MNRNPSKLPWTSWVGAGLSLALSGCLNPPGGTKGSKGALSQSFTVTATPQLSSGQSVAAGALALASDIIVEMKPVLITAGLNDDQIATVTKVANAAVAAGVVAIQSSSLALDGSTLGQPIEYAAPGVITGAVQALGQIGIADQTKKASVMKAMVGSTFSSLKGRTGTLPAASLTSLASNMASGAVSSLSSAGFQGKDVALATGSITSGGIGALQSAGFSAAALGNVARDVMSGTVSGLANIGLPSSAVAAAVANATQGAVESIAATGLSAADSVSLAGNLTASSVAGLSAFNVDQTVLIASMQSISTSAVGALKSANLGGSNLSAALQAIAAGSVSAIDKSGLNAAAVASGAAAIVAGAITGLATASDASNSTAATQAIMQGTMTSLAQSTTLTTADKTSAVTSVVGQGIASLSTIGTDAQKQAAVAAMMSTTVQNFSALGLSTSAASSQAALQSVTNTAAQSLTSAGFSGATLNAAAQSVVQGAVQGASTFTGAAATGIGTSLASVVSGVSAGMTQLAATGKTDASTAQAAISATVQTAVTAATSAAPASAPLTTAQLTSLTAQATAATPPTIAYGTSVFAFYVGIPVRLVPTATTGSFTNCAVTPALPAGLSLAANCAITGTPLAGTAATAPTTYTITPANGIGLTLSLTISPGVPMVTAYPAGFHGFVGVAIADGAGTSLRFAGGAPTACTAAPSLPAGITVTSLCSWVGTPTSVVATPYPVVFTPRNAAGAGTSFTINFSTAYQPPMIAYAAGAATSLTQGTAIATPISPVNNGGPITACTISATLPSGLFFNSTTCALYGTPSATVPTPQTFTVTATGPGGAGAPTNLVIAVAATSAPAVAYASQTYTQGQAITTLSPSFSGAATTSCSITPSLSSIGLTFDQTSCQISGTPTINAATVGSATYTVTPVGAGVTGNSASFTITLTAPSALPMLSYSSSDVTIASGQSVGTLVATVTNSVPLISCSVNPTLPSGLSLNAGNCNITGAPSGGSARSAYTILPVAAGGSGSYTIYFTVTQPEPQISYATELMRLPGIDQGSLVPTLVNSVTPTTCEIAPTLPTGLTLDDNCTIEGVAAAGQPHAPFTITPHGASGTGPAVTLYITTYGPITVTGNASPDRAVNLSWGIPAGDTVAGYAVMLRNTAMDSEIPNPGIAPTPCSTLPLGTTGCAVYIGTANNAELENLTGGEYYFYQVVAYDANYNYFAFSPVDTELAINRFNPGISDLYLAAPALNTSLNFSYVFLPTPFTGGPAFTNNFEIYIGNASQSESDSGLSQAFNTAGPGPQLSGGTGTIYATDVVRGNSTPVVYATNEAAVFGGPGYMHKIVGRQHYDGLANPQTVPISPLATTADRYGNVVYANKNGTIQVICAGNNGATYCVGQNPGQIFTIAGADAVADAAIDNLGVPQTAAIGEADALAVDAYDNIYMFDNLYGRIRVLCERNTPSTGFCAGMVQGRIYTLAGQGSTANGFLNNFPQGSGMQLDQSYGIAVDHVGNIVFGDFASANILALCSGVRGSNICPWQTSGTIIRLAGTGNPGDDSSFFAVDTTIGSPRGVAVDAYDDVYFADPDNGYVDLICNNTSVPNWHSCYGRTTGTFVHLAGDATYDDSTVNGSSWSFTASIGSPWALAANGNGNVYISDVASGHLYTLCQNSNAQDNCQSWYHQVVYAAFSGMGTDSYGSFSLTANNATTAGPITSIGVTPAGDMVVTDANSPVLRTACFSNIGNDEALCNYSPQSVGILAGIGPLPYSGQPSSRAVDEPLTTMTNVLVDADHNLIYSDAGQHQLMIVCNALTSFPCNNASAVGTRLILAGNGTWSSNPPTYAGVAASQVNLDITALALDPAGNIIMTSYAQNQIWIYCRNTTSDCNGRTANMVYILAGSPDANVYTPNDGDSFSPSASAVGQPYVATSDSAGNLFIFQQNTYNVQLMCFNAAGACGVNGRNANSTYIVAGNGTIGNGVDGPRTALGFIAAMAVDTNDNLYLADRQNSLIRFYCNSTTTCLSGQSFGATYRVVGNGNAATAPSGNLSTSTATDEPAALAVDTHNNLLYTTTGNPGLWIACRSSLGACSSGTSGHSYHLTQQTNMFSLVITESSSNTPSPAASIGATTSDVSNLALDKATGHVYYADNQFKAIRLFTSMDPP